jgi:hypothetical protein
VILFGQRDARTAQDLVSMQFLLTDGSDDVDLDAASDGSSISLKFQLLDRRIKGIPNEVVRYFAVMV